MNELFKDEILVFIFSAVTKYLFRYLLSKCICETLNLKNYLTRKESIPDLARVLTLDSFKLMRMSSTKCLKLGSDANI